MHFDPVIHHFLPKLRNPSPLLLSIMFCPFCEDLDFGQAATEQGVAHHVSFAGLCASADDD
jgi:hypothetical protein